MKTVLVVTVPFSRRSAEGEPKKAYEVGQVIEDGAEMRAVRETHPGHVVARDANPPEGDPDHKPTKAALTPKAPSET